ncbi:Extended-spectrum beta-lactamase PER-1 precursor [Chryseobacterium nakagawai]|uniref:beta-lactamase n=1 Tax=Chryseobacterium nakagawai TaxID=1241982 RepID=A0AAD1DQL2_CHRNA|nr:CGA/CIA family class A beta-lactamase [Chryseobacterium nakagawai]AZA89959.1 CGA/CIA family class A beta-lactamase [Chryseobacterium nakagawai]VEH21379.1 Extended-spectrum beta-lactamase PER-1 precursor [Chryseobacterium nakagawai]
MKKIAAIFLLISAFASAQKSSLEQRISAITKSKQATVGVSVLGFENQFKYSQNGEKKLAMMSVFKFHVACAALDLVDKGKLSLDQKIFIKKSELYNTWSPYKEKHPEGNTEATLSEIIYYTVALSDNNLCDILIELVGGTQAVQKFMNSKGVKDFQIKYTERGMAINGWDSLFENYTTANSTVQLLKKFYDGKLLSKKSTDYLMKIMLGTKTGTNKIIEQLPKGTPIAHKTGSSGKKDNFLTIAENDMGIITLPNGKHYAIAVYVSNSKESEAENCKIISDISKAVWDNFNK